MRLQKYLAECSIASRRGSEKLIQEGRVTVDGELAHLGQTVNPDIHTVLFDGDPVVPDAKVYVLLNKPQGVITTAKDTHDRKTVIDLITGVSARIFPVGRLDMDVTGTLLLTNDGELTNRLAHPRYEVDKVYHAWVKGIVDNKTIRKLQQGVMLEDGITAPAKAKILKTQHRRPSLDSPYTKDANDSSNACAPPSDIPSTTSAEYPLHPSTQADSSPANGATSIRTKSKN